VKGLLFLLAAGAAVYYGYQYFQNPSQIKDPIYGEIRVDFTVGSRQLDLVLFARMTDEADCKMRSEKVWQKIITDCEDCSMRLVDCKRELAPRYSRLFDDESINIAYLSFTRGSRFERDGRMVIWGMTGKEGDQVCDIIKGNLQKRYSGQIRCVPAR